MSNKTPTKVKRAHQPHVSTPIPPKKAKKQPLVGVYCPQASRLKRNFKYEFGKFLKSVKTFSDNLEANSIAVLPLRKRLRFVNKQLSRMHVYFKSLQFWKTFYSEYMANVDTVMECFRFEDVREVNVVVESHRLPEVLQSYVVQQLLDWRNLFRDVQWMKMHLELCEQVGELEKSAREVPERFELIREISMEIELSKLKIGDFESLSEEPEQLIEAIISRIGEEKKAKNLADQLKNMPVLSRRNNTKEWCRKNFDASTPCAVSSMSSESSTSSVSDDEFSADNNDSSIFGDGPDSSRDLSSTTSEEDPDENSFENFFNDHGI